MSKARLWKVVQQWLKEWPERGETPQQRSKEALNLVTVTGVKRKLITSIFPDTQHVDRTRLLHMVVSRRTIKMPKAVKKD